MVEGLEDVFPRVLPPLLPVLLVLPVLPVLPALVEYLLAIPLPEFALTLLVPIIGAAIVPSGRAVLSSI